jgi:hypothetical protein
VQNLFYEQNINYRRWTLFFKFNRLFFIERENIRWHITIADANKAAVESKISKYKDVASAVEFDVNNVQLREALIKKLIL